MRSVVTEQSRDAKVKHLDHGHATRCAREKHVVGLEVAVHDPGPMRGPEGVSELSHHEPEFGGREGATLLDALSEVVAFEQLHGDPGGARGGVDAGCDHLHHVGAVNLRAHPGFAGET